MQTASLGRAERVHRDQCRGWLLGCHAVLQCSQLAYSIVGQWLLARESNETPVTPGVLEHLQRDLAAIGDENRIKGIVFSRPNAG